MKSAPPQLGVHCIVSWGFALVATVSAKSDTLRVLLSTASLPHLRLSHFLPSVSSTPGSYTTFDRQLVTQSELIIIVTKRLDPR